MRTYIAMAALLSTLAACPLAAAGGPDQFEKLGTLRAVGGVTGQVIAPGPGGQGQRLYISYLYVFHTLEVVSLDLDTGKFQIFPNPTPSETGLRSTTMGPDGKIYYGTLPGAHFYCLDPKKSTLVDLGRPSQTESYIWALTFGPDARLYGVTYGQAKLVRYDPKTGVLEDLGRMDPAEAYGHSIAASDDDFIYAGIGFSKANIAAYRISTGEHREILPAKSQVVDQAVVHRGRDGKIYGHGGNDWYRLEGWNAVPVAASEVSPEVPENVLPDGRTVKVVSNVARIADPKTGAVAERPFDYRGNELDLFRVAIGPDGALYGSGLLPGDLVRFNRGAGTFENIGRPAGGEIYSFLTLQHRLLMAGYSSLAPLMAYDPSKPYHPIPFNEAGSPTPFHPGETPGGNPVLVHFAGEDHSWRPTAAIEGPDGQVYIGAVPGYGKLGGALTIWNVATGAVENHEQIVENQSVVTLAAAGDLIVGGTAVGGGGGSHSIEKEAKLFLWDTKAHKKISETVPVAGAKGIGDLIAVKGRVFGLAGETLFVFDPVTREVTHRSPVDFGPIVYNSVGVGPDGKIWGLARKGIFQIDPETCQATLTASAPEPITGGFAMDTTGLYYASGSSLYRYTFRPLAARK